MHKLTLSLGAAVLSAAGLAAAAPALAQQGDVTRSQAQERAAERFAKMDANGDGVLNAADREARRAAMFDRLDADRNGSISRAEFAAMQAARGERREARAERRGGAHAGHRMGGHGGKAMGRMAMARAADTNGDNAISRAEFTAAALARFDRVDTDRNGAVSQAERQAAREAMRAQWQARRQAQPAN
ncbi:MAG: EF-hand domain-containing protein [Cypionkella sp.]